MRKSTVRWWAALASTHHRAAAANNGFNMLTMVRHGRRVAAWLAVGCALCGVACPRSPGDACPADLDAPQAPLRSLSAGVIDAAALCPGAEHVYRIDPLPVGTLFGVQLTPSGSAGAIDMILSSSFTRTELRSANRWIDRPLELGVPADGGPYALTVRSLEGPVEGDTFGHRYELTLAIFPEPTNDCCTPGAASGSAAPSGSSVNGPGCEDDAILLCVCQLDPVCCTGSYDALCITEAVGVCGLACGVSGCDDPASGCDDDAVERCVCDIDPYCCGVCFDDNCARLARHPCGGALAGAD